MQDRDLRESLRRIGARFPALEYEGELIDGRRRQHFCEELGIALDVRHAPTLQDACSELYATHPDRAVVLARKLEPDARLLDVAELCSATPSAVAAVLQAQKPKPSKKRIPGSNREIRKLAKGPPLVKVLVAMEPELKAYAEKCALLRGHGNLNRLVRDALWHAIALEVPHAPLQQPRRIGPVGRRRTG